MTMTNGKKMISHPKMTEEKSHNQLSICFCLACYTRQMQVHKSDEDISQLRCVCCGCESLVPDWYRPPGWVLD